MSNKKEPNPFSSYRRLIEILKMILGLVLLGLRIIREILDLLS